MRLLATTATTTTSAVVATAAKRPAARPLAAAVLAPAQAARAASSSANGGESHGHRDSGGSSSSGSSGGSGSSSRRRDYRGPLLVGGSLVGASTIQYYLHHRALLAGQAPAATATAATAAATAAAAASGLRAMSSSSSSSPPPPSKPPTVQAPSVARRWFGTSSSAAAAAAAAAATKEGGPLSGLPITLYQYKICPFCCKVKAVLDFYKVPYETLDVNPLTKAEIKFSPDYRKVPIARLGEEVIRDSAAIVHRVSNLLREAKAAPAKDLNHFFSPEAERWAEWADMELAVLLFPNITRTFNESFQAFSYVKDVPHFSLVDKWSNLWVGSAAMWAAQGKIKKKYNIDDERAALFAALKDWTSEVGGKPFLGGNEPNFGDLAVYACLRAIEGLDAHRDILANDAHIGAWYARVEKAVGPTACTKAE